MFDDFDSEVLLLLLVRTGLKLVNLFKGNVRVVVSAFG